MNDRPESVLEVGVVMGCGASALARCAYFRVYVA